MILGASMHFFFKCDFVLLNNDNTLIEPIDIMLKNRTTIYHCD